MFRSPSSSSVLPIFYPNMYERDQVQEVDPEAQATGSTSLTMHPGILLGLSEYYCKAPRVVLRAYLVSVFYARRGCGAPVACVLICVRCAPYYFPVHWCSLCEQFDFSSHQRPGAAVPFAIFIVA
jgi:hypothetical protein